MNAVDRTADGLPDLPGLESVETRDRTMLVPLMAYGVFLVPTIVGIVWMYFRFGEFLQPKDRVFLGIFAGLIGWVILRVSTGYFHYRTSDAGILLRGFLRSRLIPWIDIESASVRCSRVRTTMLTLKTKRGTVKIFPRAFSGKASTGDIIIASVWQHLRRLGRADSIKLPETALGLWEEVPDDVPSELDWGKAGCGRARLRAIFGIAFVTAIAALPWFLFPFRFPKILMSGCMSLMWAIMGRQLLLPELLRKAITVSVRDGYLEAQLPFEKVYLPWSEVVYAQFVQDALSICFGSRKKEVRVPYIEGSRESEQLVLAVIRKLRTAGVPQAIALPALVSRNPEVLQGLTLSSEAQGRKMRAFLNTLDEPVKTRMRRIWSMQIIAIFVGIALGMLVMFANPFERLARAIQSTLDTQFLIMTDGICVGVPVMIVTIVALLGGATLLGRKLATPYVDVWKRMQLVGSSPKAEKWLAWIVAAMVGACVLLIPPYVDCYTRVTNRGVAIDRYFAIDEVSYDWSKIRTVELRSQLVSDHGQAESLDEYTIRFTDGSRLHFDEGNVSRENKEDLAKAMEYVARMSGKPISYR